jgi:hypothetical protein
MRYVLVDVGTGNQLSAHPSEGDAIEAFKQTTPADQRHDLEIRETNGGDRVIAGGLGLSLLAYGPRPAVIWNLADALKHEVGLQEAMRWVAQVEADPRSSIKADGVRQRWERHQLAFRALVERFVAQPTRANTGLVADIGPLHRERDDIRDLAKRLPRDAAKAESASVGDLREALLRVQREQRG